jgi:recombination protein RecA
MANITFNVVGEHYPTGRVILPFHSLNVAVSGDEKEGRGFPTRTLVEFAGDTGVGKSTLVTSLASYISQGLGNIPIAFLDLEGQDEDTIYNALSNSGYKADEFRWVNPKGKSKGANSDESLLGALEDTLYDDPPCIGVLDSVAAISPVAETEGDIGDANMGRRAFPMAQFTRRVTRALRTIETPSVMFMLNHRYEKLGAIGVAKQYTSPGGSVKNNLEKLSIEVKVPYVDYISSGSGKAEGRWERGWILEGKVKKNRSGAKNNQFQVFIYGGQGAHVGMSSVIDCLASNLAEVKTGRLHMDGKDFGLLSRIVDTKFDDPEFFIPFQNALKAEVVVEEDDTDSE